MATAATTAKIISLCLMGLITLVLGLLPIQLSKCVDWKNSRKGRFAVSALSCFGGGVILTTCITHMMPEVKEFLVANVDAGKMSDLNLPLAEIFVLCGFFLVYLVEELVNTFLLDADHKGHDHSGKVTPADSNSNAGSDETATNSSSKKGSSSSIAAKSKDAESVSSGSMYSGANDHNDIAHSHEALGIEMMTDKEGKASFRSVMRGFMVILALSLHAVFEGIAMGLTPSASNVWRYFFAISSHKYVIALCLGFQFVTNGIKNSIILLYIGVFAVISPIGIGIGLALTGNQDETAIMSPSVVVMQGLACGTLLYVVFFEVLEKERSQRTIKGIYQVLFVILGFVVMVLAQVAEGGHGHSHGGDDHDDHDDHAGHDDHDDHAGHDDHDDHAGHDHS